MRFWKPIILTTLSFFAVATTILVTSCEKNPCDQVDCKNGGSCGHGLCKCPTGFEGPRCEAKSVARFIGTYGGFIECDNGAQVIDSAVIWEDPAMRNFVYVLLKSDYTATGKILHGYTTVNESTYAITIVNNDSDKANSVNYLKTWTVTLQGDNKLLIHTYERNETNTDDTLEHSCYFLGFKN
ncbi:MAG: calcium-binding EGF-like domain-containing protein [Bacteroidota bacterium]